MPRLNPSNVFFFLILLIFSLAAHSRNSVWIDQLTLWLDASKKSPDKARPYNDIGNVYLLQDRFSDAIRMYQKAIQLKPDFYEAHYNLGSIYSRYGMWSIAIKEFQKAIETGGSGEYRIHYKLGEAFAEKGIYDDAIKEYKISLFLQPDNPDVYYSLARVHSMKMERDAAVDYLLKAIKAGFKDHESIIKDRAFDNIRSDERYRIIIERKR